MEETDVYIIVSCRCGMAYHSHDVLKLFHLLEKASVNFFTTKLQTEMGKEGVRGWGRWVGEGGGGKEMRERGWGETVEGGQGVNELRQF